MGLKLRLGRPASIQNQLYAPHRFEVDEDVRQVEWEKMEYRDMYHRKLPLQSFHTKLYLNYMMTCHAVLCSALSCTQYKF